MRTHYTNHVEAGDEVTVCGWAEEVRDLGSLVFIVLRDREGTIQLTCKEDENEDAYNVADGIGKEDVVCATGTVEENEQAPNGIEIKPESLSIINQAERPLPMEVAGNVDSDFSTRLDNRFLDLRSHEVMDVFRIRDLTVTALREWYDNNEFIEIHTPIVQQAGAEGGATLFPVIFYGDEAFLRQSPQLYKQMLMAAGFDRVYEVGPSFRAEKFATSRHVSEFTQWDVELAFIEDEHDVMDVLEDSLVHVLETVKERGKEELDALNATVTVPDDDFPRITFNQAREILREEYDHVPEDDNDIDTKGEKLLGEYFKEQGHDFVFIVGYPDQKFYYMQGVDENRDSRKFDLLYKGQELVSGGQREHRFDVIMEALAKDDMDPSNFYFYLDAFKHGMPPHGGFGLGIDRLVQKITGVSNVQETILFPRTPQRLTP